MTGADVAQRSGYTGKGIKVAIIDSGTDYDHPDLGGCFGPGCRVEQGFDFVGDAYQPNAGAAGYSPMPVPDPYLTTATATARTCRALSAPEPPALRASPASLPT